MLDFLQGPLAEVGFGTIKYIEVGEKMVKTEWCKSGRWLWESRGMLAAASLLHHQTCPALPPDMQPLLQARLKLETAPLSAGCDAVCLFVNDRVSEEAS